MSIHAIQTTKLTPESAMLIRLYAESISPGLSDALIFTIALSGRSQTIDLNPKYSMDEAAISMIMGGIMDILEGDEAPSKESTETPAAQNLAKEAIQIVLGDRNDAYGDPADDYGRLALIWSGLLKNKLKDGALLTAKECILLMAALKLNREVHKHQPDNLRDLHGYGILGHWVETGIRPSS